MAVTELDDTTFEKEVAQKNEPAIVDFWASWCGPCMQMAPIFHELAEEYKGRLHFYKVNTENCEAVPLKYGIRSIPTLLFFSHGEVKETLIGFQRKELLKQAIDRFLKLGS